MWPSMDSTSSGLSSESAKRNAQGIGGATPPRPFTCLSHGALIVALIVQGAKSSRISHCGPMGPCRSPTVVNPTRS